MSFFWGSTGAADTTSFELEPRIDYSPTEEEKGEIAEVRTMLDERRSEWVFAGEPPFEFKDMLVLRFIRGPAKHVLEKAAHMLVKHVVWRREKKIEDITEADVQSELDKGFVIPEGKSRQGRPTVWVSVRFLDKYDRDLDVMEKFIIYCCEKQMRRTIPMDERYCIVFDLRELAMKNVDYEVIKLLIGILQTNYPEVLDQALVVESPFFFKACWTVIRPWLDPVTATKILFCSYAETERYIARGEWPDAFVQDADKDVAAGGNSSDGDKNDN